MQALRTVSSRSSSQISFTRVIEALIQPGLLALDELLRTKSETDAPTEITADICRPDCECLQALQIEWDGDECVASITPGGLGTLRQHLKDVGKNDDIQYFLEGKGPFMKRITGDDGRIRHEIVVGHQAVEESIARIIDRALPGLRSTVKIEPVARHFAQRLKQAA